MRERGIRTILLKEGGADISEAEADCWSVIAEVEADEDSGDGDELAEGFVALLDDLAGEDDWLLWVETDRLLPPWTVDPEIFAGVDLGPLLEDDVPVSLEDNPEEMPAEAAERPPLDPLGEPPALLPKADLLLWERLHSTYAAKILEFDATVGFLLERLQERLPDRSASFSVISLSGLSLGEHGTVGPEPATLYEERVHLGWMTRLPGNRLAGQRFAALTQPADILPTLLRTHSGMGAREVIGTKGELGISWLRAEGATTVSIRLADWYAILPPEVGEAKLYRKPDDRWEVNEVAQHHGEWLDALHAFARAWLAGEALPELKPPGG